MNRQMIVDHLAQAERHVSEGERHLASQRRIVAELERDGHPVEQARELLRLFEDTQAMHIADRDRLREDLAWLDSPLYRP